jgi:hypothetical protein
MKLREDFATHLLVIMMRVFLILFAMRYVGFSATQALVLTVSIVMSLEIN